MNHYYLHLIINNHANNSINKDKDKDKLNTSKLNTDKTNIGKIKRNKSNDNFIKFQWGWIL